MKIRKLGDDLFKSLCEVYPDNTARERVEDMIDELHIDYKFMSLYYEEEFKNYYEKQNNRYLQKETTDDLDVRFNSSRPRDKRESMEKIVGDNGMDELDYANIDPSRRKNYYYQNT